MVVVELDVVDAGAVEALVEDIQGNWGTGWLAAQALLLKGTQDNQDNLDVEKRLMMQLVSVWQWTELPVVQESWLWLKVRKLLSSKLKLMRHLKHFVDHRGLLTVSELLDQVFAMDRIL